MAKTKAIGGNKGQLEVAMTSTFPADLLQEVLDMWGEAITVNIGMRIERWEQRGLTTGQLRLMVALRDSPSGGMALGELAELMHVSPATITGITRQSPITIQSVPPS